MNEEQIQAWTDDRFGVPNTFNIQLLIDFQKEVQKESTSCVGLELCCNLETFKTLLEGK